MDDEKSAFKTAYREDWGTRQYMTAAILNEIRIMRADNVALHGNGKMEPVLLRSPKEQEAAEQRAAENRSLRGGILAQLHRDIPNQITE